MFGLRAGCLSARGTCPFRGSCKEVSFFLLLSLSKPDLEDEEFLLVADDEAEEDDDDDEDEEDEGETAAEPPSKVALVALLAVLGEPLGVVGMDLSESSRTSMTSKLSWLSVLDDFFYFFMILHHLFGSPWIVDVALVWCLQPVLLGNYLFSPSVWFSQFVAEGWVIWFHWYLEDLCPWH